MDWTALAAPAAIAATISALAAFAQVGWRSKVDHELARLRSDVEEKLAARRAIVDEKLATLRSQFDKELAEQKARLDNRAAYAAERVAHQLMMDRHWRLRSFDVIKHHLGGFDDNELRQILVRAGGVRFESKSGIEMWGLIERNTMRLGVMRLDQDPAERPQDGDAPDSG